MSIKQSGNEANRVLYPFLKLRNDIYVLEISNDEVESLKVSDEDIESISKNLQEINNFIEQAKSDPNHVITLFDPQEIDLSATLQQTLPSGNLSANGQEVVSAGFFAPSGAADVRFLCKAAAAPLAFYTCRTHSFGITKTETATGSAFVSTEVIVPLAAGNVNASVDFRTSDPNGGVASWQVRY